MLPQWVNKLSLGSTKLGQWSAIYPTGVNKLPPLVKRFGPMGQQVFPPLFNIFGPMGQQAPHIGQDSIVSVATCTPLGSTSYPRSQQVTPGDNIVKPMEQQVTPPR